jgi:Do/DeqQ family serine protease
MAYRRLQFLMLTLLVAVSVTAGMFLASGLNLTPPASAEQSAIPANRELPPAYSLPNFADIAEEANPAVVSITSSAMVDQGNRRRSLLRDFFFGPDPEGGEGDSRDDDRRRQDSGGSGFIISEDGYILTNYHVVEDADKVEVQLENENRRHRADVVGTDRLTDLALLKIKAGRRLPTIPLGDSDAVRVGEWVVAIGNPLYWDHTVTVGVISAVGRRLPGDPSRDSSFDNFLQTDAAINFGNSGGPLLNLYGEAIGINTAISRMGQGIGFTIPINMAKQIVDQLKEHGRVARGFLGIEIQDINNMDPDQREYFDLQEKRGAFVSNVTPGLPGDRAGIQRGDAVIEVDGRPIESSQELIAEITSRSPGEDAGLTVIRNGRRVKLTAHLVDREDASASDLQPARETRGDATDTEDLLGFTVSPVEPDIMRYYELERDAEGVVVTSSDPFSEAYEKGLREGALILEVNRKRVRSLAEFREEIRTLKQGDLVNFYVQTGDILRFVTLRFGEGTG